MSEKKILRVGLLSEVHNLDPKDAQDLDSGVVLNQLLESPFEVLPGGTEVEPVLFSGPLVKVSGGEHPIYEASVREGLMFSDGEVVTPQQVVDCLSENEIVQQQAKVSLIGDKVTFELERPNARFDITLSHLGCSVRRQVGGRLIGSGPFYLSPESTPGDLRLLRNPHYRRPVHLDEIHFVSYALDSSGRPTALVEALEKGEVDLSSVLPRDDISALSGVRKSFQPGLSTALLYLYTERPTVSDPRVRRAIAYAVDRLAVAESSYSNALAFKAKSLIPRNMNAVDDRIPFDLDRARELLEEPGVIKPERLTLLEIWGSRPYLPDPGKVSQVLREQLGELGIGIDVVETESSQDYFAKLLEGDYDLVLSGWVADTLDPSDFMESILASDRIPTRDNLATSANHGRLRSPAMDEALAAFRGDRSPQQLEEIMKVLREEVPVVPLMYGASATVMSFRVLNFKPSPLKVFSMADLDLRI